MKNKGFTLVETLVAVSILVIGSLGPIVIAAQGIASGGYAKDQITAYYLAQEGIEYIRSIRDGNALQGLPSSSWLNGIDIACDGSAVGEFGCTIDARTDAIAACGSGGCAPMRIHPSGIYGYAGPTTSIYTRTIKLLQPSTNDIVPIQVTMQWTSRGTSRSLTLTEDIYNTN